MPSRAHRRLKQKKVSKGDKKGHRATAKERVKTTIYMIIIIVIIVTFAGGTFIGVLTRGPQKTILGKYGNREIIYEPETLIYASVMDKLEQYKGQEAQYTEKQIFRQSFEDTLVLYAILEEVEKSGFIVSTDNIKKTIARSQTYMLNGKFDDKRYTLPTVMEFTKQQINIGQYINDFGLNITQSQKEKESIEQMAEEERKIRFVEFNYSDYPEQELINFFTNNRNLFKKMKLSRILIKTGEDEANEVWNKLNDQISTFEDLAKDHSEDIYAERGGEIGFQYFYELLDNLIAEDEVNKIFELDLDEYTKPIKIGDNWTIYRCDQVAQEADISQEELLQDVRFYMVYNEKGIVQDFFEQKGLEFKAIAENRGFLAACDQFDLSSYQSDYFPLNINNLYFLKTLTTLEESAPSLYSASTDETFFAEAFSLDIDSISKPIILDDKIIIFTLLDIRKATEEEISEVEQGYLSFIRNNFNYNLDKILIKRDKVEDNLSEIFKTQ